MVMSNKDGKYVIADLRDRMFMVDNKHNVAYFDTEEEALNVCGMYEFENVWVMKLVYNHIEENNEQQETWNQ